MRRLTHLVVLVAFIFSCGGQWGVLQCVAWANMIREYSEMVPLTEAVSMTFSGQYPCPICKAIAEKKNSEQQKALVLGKYDKKFFSPVAIHAFKRISSDFDYPDFVVSFRVHSDSPPIPPPRTALI
ncbi:MAG: hypothetical protein LV480_14910 [Methylacidiphilales bacterium]|nr:hypothetical protein [Candidatus Methylacidiphilales bacterium]